MEEKNTREQLKEYREKLAELSEEEKKKRDLYLKKLSKGDIEGPLTGFSSIDKPWLQYFEDDAILSNIPKTTALNYMIEKNVGNESSNALNFFGIKTTYKKLFSKIDQTARALVSLGVTKGDIVTINSVTLPQTIYLLYALNKIGAIANLTDVRTDSKGMQHYFNEGNSKFVFTLENFYENFKPILNETKVEKIILLNPMDTAPAMVRFATSLKSEKTKSTSKNDLNVMNWKQFMKNAKKVDKVESCPYEPNYPCAIVHTSGTTNTPKSVVLTNENFNAMPLQYSVSDFKYAKNQSLLNIIPIFTAYGVVNALHMPLCLGMTNIVYPKVVNEDFTEIIRKFKPNHVIAIPMHWQFLLNDKNMENVDLSFLKTAACGGDKLNIELEKELNEFLRKSGSPSKIIKGYGMTELSACAVTNTNNMSKIGSVGIPLIKNNIAIIDPETKEELTYGQSGEICIESPTMMKEYLNNKEGTDDIIKKYHQQRWIHTGDLGNMGRDGNLQIDGRLKRLIIRRGFKISALAIENVIMENQNVENCAVVKAPHVEDGEVPYVYIVLKDNANESDALKEIKEACMKSLPEYYLPENYRFLKSLPYTKNSKLDICLLEKQAYEEFLEKEDKETVKTI